MSTLTPREQKLFDAAKATLPRTLFSDVTNSEALAAAAKLFAKTWDQIDEWFNATFITRATGAWLTQHARDRGTSPQAGETVDALRYRLRTYEDVVTPSVLVVAANGILAADGVTGTATLLELRGARARYTRAAFFSRGYRFGGQLNTIIMILPYGTSAATAASVAESIRIRKAGGIVSRVEVRGVP